MSGQTFSFMVHLEIIVGSVSPPILFFFFKKCLATIGALLFHINFRVSWSISTKIKNLLAFSLGFCCLLLKISRLLPAPHSWAAPPSTQFTCGSLVPSLSHWLQRAAAEVHLSVYLGDGCLTPHSLSHHLTLHFSSLAWHLLLLQAPFGHPPPQLKVKGPFSPHAYLLMHRKVQLYRFPSLPLPHPPTAHQPAPYPNSQSHKHSPPALEEEMARSLLLLASTLQASADGEI